MVEQYLSNICILFTDYEALLSLAGMFLVVVIHALLIKYNKLDDTNYPMQGFF